jgi:hypothetical protein
VDKRFPNATAAIGRVFDGATILMGALGYAVFPKILSLLYPRLPKPDSQFIEPPYTS